MTYVRFYLIVLGLFFITGCAYLPGSTYIQNRDKHYLDAKSTPPLRIPPGLSSQSVHNHYPISERNYPESSKDVSAIPPGLYSPQ